jgi:hypothetical protein
MTKQYSGTAPPRAQKIILEMKSRQLNSKVSRIQLGESFIDVPTLSSMNDLEKENGLLKKKLHEVTANQKVLIATVNGLIDELKAVKEQLDNKMDVKF